MSFTAFYGLHLADVASRVGLVMEDDVIEQHRHEDPFVQAAGDGDLQTVRRRVEDDPSCLSGDKGKNAVMMAAREGHIRVVEYLIHHGCGINGEQLGWTTLHFLASHPDGYRVILKLAKMGIDCHSSMTATTTTSTSSFSSADNDNADGGDHRNESSFLNDSTTSSAREVGEWHMSQLMLRVLCGPLGSPMHEAVTGGHMYNVNALVQAGCSITSRDRWWKTPVEAVREEERHVVIAAIQEGFKQKEIREVMHHLLLATLVVEGEEGWARAFKERRVTRGLPLPGVEYMTCGSTSSDSDSSEGKRARVSSLLDLVKKVGELDSGIRRLIVSFI